MSVISMEKPTFTREQIVPASAASKKFGEIRRRAKAEPQFISDHNEIDTVILDYRSYETMYMELQHLREQAFYSKVAARIQEGDRDRSRTSVALKDSMGESAYEAFERIDPDLISDEELFDD